MRRSGLTLILAVLALTLHGAARAAVTVSVFQDPSGTQGNTGTPGLPSLTIGAIAPATTPIQLFYQTGPGASTSGTVCLNSLGNEVCGWDIWVSTTGSGVVLQSFVPDTGVGSDIVWAITGNPAVFRANGGIPTTGEPVGIHRIGTLNVSKTNAASTGDVKVSGNLFVSAALAAVPVTTGNILATATGGVDFDGDGFVDTGDNCPTLANSNQADGDNDLVGDLCDNCTTFSNARVPGWTFAAGGSAYLASNQWATLTGGQRDDDHDGFGNFCDGDFTSTLAVTAADTGLYKNSIGCAKASDTCGVITAGLCVGSLPCAKFDLNSANSTESSAGGISAADTGRYKLLVGQPVGPKCAACTGTGSVPLPCEAGTAGGC